MDLNSGSGGDWRAVLAEESDVGSQSDVAYSGAVVDGSPFSGVFAVVDDDDWDAESEADSVMHDEG